MKCSFITLLIIVLLLSCDKEEGDYIARDVVFESPMTFVNREGAAMVRQRISAGTEPQASAFIALIADADAALKYKPNPPSHMNIMGGYEPNSNLSEMRAIMDRESMAAYSPALAWLYSGERKYAEKAAEVLRTWTEKGTTFGGGDAGLQIGSWFNRMLYAADILKTWEGWSTEDRNAFEEWWRTQALPYTLTVMRTRDNNWLDAALLGVLTAAVVFEDLELLDEGLQILDGYFFPRNRNRDWKFAVNENGVFLPREVTRNEGRSGITYTAYALTNMVQAFEIARYCGYNWWHREATNGATIKGAIDQYFRWMDKGEDFPWNSNPGRYSPTGVRRNPYEFANNYFHGEIPGLIEWLNAYRPVNGRQGDPYITLNHGDMPPLPF